MSLAWALQIISYLKVQSRTSTLYLCGDIGLHKRMENGHSLGSAFLVLSDFGFVFYLGSTTSGRLRLAVCVFSASPVQGV